MLAKMNPGMDGIVEVFKGVFYQYGKHQTLWFIASLYVYSLMFYWVDKFCRTPIRLAIGCVLLIIMGQLLQYVLGCPRLPYKLESSLWAMAIMGIGKLYKLYEREVDAKIMKWQFAAVSLVLYIVLIYSFEANVLYDGHPNWFLAISIPMTGLHWMLYLSKYVIVNMKSLLFIGSNSLVYFAIHRQVLNAVEATTKKIMASLSIEPSLWSNLLEMAVIAIIIVIPVWIINKYIPQVTGKGWKLWNA